MTKTKNTSAKKSAESDIRQLFRILEAEIFTIHAWWSMHQKMFAASPERIELLNRSASSVFSMVQQATLLGMYMRIASVCDPSTSLNGKDKNLTLKRLIEEAALEQDTRIAEYSGQLDRWIERIRQRRNKQLAHLDLDVALGLKHLDEIRVKDVETCLALIRLLMSRISKLLGWGPPTDPVVQADRLLGGADELISRLEGAERADTDRAFNSADATN